MARTLLPYYIEIWHGTNTPALYIVACDTRPLHLLLVQCRLLEGREKCDFVRKAHVHDLMNSQLKQPQVLTLKQILEDYWDRFYSDSDDDEETETPTTAGQSAKKKRKAYTNKPPKGSTLHTPSERGSTCIPLY